MIQNDIILKNGLITLLSGMYWAQSFVKYAHTYKGSSVNINTHVNAKGDYIFSNRRYYNVRGIRKFTCVIYYILSVLSFSCIHLFNWEDNVFILIAIKLADLIVLSLSYVI